MDVTPACGTLHRVSTFGLSHGTMCAITAYRKIPIGPRCDPELAVGN